MMNGHTPVILTIDDEDAIRTSIHNYLTDYNYEVLEAANGRIGLEIIHNQTPDLVMVDLRMPEVNGLDVLSETTKSFPDLPIIVISGTGSIQDVIEALHLGAWDYLLKPIQDLSVMLHSVERNLERARLIEENRNYQTHLEFEVKKRTHELSENQAMLSALLNAEDNVAILMDLNGNIQALNTSAKQMLSDSDTPTEEFNGKNIFSYIKGSIAHSRKKLFAEVVELDSPVTIDEEYNGRYLESTLYPVKDINNKITKVAFFARDMTLRIKAEQQKERDLREKEMLLKEIHHRVKNNLQVICSLLSLQSRHIKDPNALDMFTESRDRVRSMALVHELLYGSKNFSEIDFAEYLNRLTNTLFKAYATDKTKVDLQITVGDVSLGVDLAIPCGLVINELISNALKHAFPEDLGHKGCIQIYMEAEENNYISLIVKDNGAGLPEGFNMMQNDSLGMHLITLLAEDQLQGKILLEQDNGTKFHIRFPMTTNIAHK
ncbi:response regulator [bacterium]|nr:response regulator [bacterium]